ncbi:MAG: hypothetical protein KBF45_00355 [Cyclobacteriaceae bacterium]|jgi:hypothetical protein|nr:hypothetical protein [Cyclobacteriaceae bacterium]
MTRALLLVATLFIVLSACTQRLICPAYQSSFIYDKPTQREKFVYYNESTTQPREILASNSKTITLPPRDSSWLKSDALRGPALPHVRHVKKDRYLLLPEKTYKKALKALRTVEMKPVYPKKDSLDIQSELDSAARSISDTLSSESSTRKVEVDSAYKITKTKEKYNLDQDSYMWYFRDVLVLPDVRAAMMEEGQVRASNKKAAKKAKGGFFNKIFKKKNKKDSTAVESLQEPIAQDTTQAKPKKKGLGGLFKKKSKVEKADSSKKADPAKKKEEDDGF